MYHHGETIKSIHILWWNKEISNRRQSEPKKIPVEPRWAAPKTNIRNWATDEVLSQGRHRVWGKWSFKIVSLKRSCFILFVLFVFVVVVVLLLFFQIKWAVFCIILTVLIWNVHTWCEYWFFVKQNIQYAWHTYVFVVKCLLYAVEGSLCIEYIMPMDLVAR